MILRNLTNNGHLRIAIDLDDTIFDWMGEFNKRYPNIDWKTEQNKINKLVLGMRKDKKFWENLPLLERPDFEPTIYATKRVNSKTYTRKNLAKYGLPIKPIYQIYSQSGNKARIIRGHCDVLIDDSVFNVMQAISVGFPAILITRPHNEHVKNIPRVNTLTIKEITEVYIKYYTR